MKDFIQDLVLYMIQQLILQKRITIEEQVVE